MEKFFYYASLISSALTVVVFVLGLVHYKVGRDYIQFENSGKKAEGTITDLLTRTERYNDGDDTKEVDHYYIAYQFRDGLGKEHSGEQLLNEDSWSQFKKGQAVEVTYLSDQPEKSVVLLDTLEYGHREYKNVFSRALILFLLTLCSFAIYLYLAYQRVTKPVVIGSNWIKTSVEVRRVSESSELIDRLFLKRITLGFNVPLPPSVKAGSLPWVERSIKKELAGSVNEGDEILIFYPAEDQTQAVMEMELR